MIRFAPRLLLAAVLAGCATPPDASLTRAPAERPDALTLDRILAQPSLTGTSPIEPTWSLDSRHLAFLWNPDGQPQREIWLANADGSGLRQLTDAPDGGSVRELAWLPSSQALVYLRSGQVWRVDLEGRSTAVALEPGDRSDLAVSPDGRLLSYLQSGDLWLVESESGLQRRATFVGEPSISDLPLGRYARPEVEIGPPIWGGPTYAWAPDSRSIAIHRVDRGHLRTVPFPHYLGPETDPNFVRRSYPGDANESRRVGILTVESGDLDLLDLPDPTGVRVVGFDWAPDGRLLVDRESDTAVERWLHVYDPPTRTLSEVYHDRREARIYTSVASAWHPDGEHVLLLSDRADRYGLYLVGPDLAAPQRLTPPEFDVTGGPFVCAASGAIYYQANQPSPYERHVYRLAPDGSAPVRITTLAGQHVPTPSPDFTRVALRHSADSRPPELLLATGDGAAPESRLTNSPPPAFAERAWARARYLSFPSRIDDYTLHARILEPPQLEPGRRYPVLFGPVYSNTVRNRWAGRWALLQQLLVDRGYLVVQVDVRGSTGYGRAFREEFLLDFAGDDLEDLHSAVEHLRTLPHVDPSRIGIWGSSYGGTLTVYSLLKKPGLFQAGVACASAVDPHFFGSDDVAIVRRPEGHPETFERGAAQYAPQLQDPLLLIHGMQDQVVPFKTVLDLSDALMRADKDFDFAFAPTATHSWARDPHHARHLYGKLIAFFDRHLQERP